MSAVSLPRFPNLDQLKNQAKDLLHAYRNGDDDAARALYYSRFLGLDDPDDPQLYHLVVNTSDVGVDYAVRMVVDATLALADGSLHRSD